MELKKVIKRIQKIPFETVRIPTNFWIFLKKTKKANLCFFGIRPKKGDLKCFAMKKSALKCGWVNAKKRFKVKKVV